MWSWRSVVLLAVLWVPFGALDGRQESQPVLHSRGDLVSLSVSVTDRANHCVADLEQPQHQRSA
jgi:hypothetical protein